MFSNQALGNPKRSSDHPKTGQAKQIRICERPRRDLFCAFSTFGRCRGREINIWRIPLRGVCAAVLRSAHGWATEVLARRPHFRSAHACLPRAHSGGGRAVRRPKFQVVCGCTPRFVCAANRICCMVAGPEGEPVTVWLAARAVCIESCGVCVDGVA